jgi:signal transduction histidine kinase
MRSRARKLGGSFEASSRNGAGTIVTLDVPLDHRPKP